MSPDNSLPIYLPNGTILLSDGGIDYAGDGDHIDYPNGTRVDWDGDIYYSNGTHQYPDGRVRYHNGTCRDTDSTYYDC